LSNPKSFSIVKCYKVGVDLKSNISYENGDIVFEVQELNPDELMFYHLRPTSNGWDQVGFEIEAGFWHHAF